MGQNKSIRETKGFKRLTKAIISIFLASTVLNNVSPFNNGNVVQAEAPTGSVVYTEVEPISWTRTPDVRNGQSFNVHNARANFNDYFSGSGTNWTLDKKPASNNDPGIIWVDSLFGNNKYTFDYDMLVFFSPSGVDSLKKNFPNFEQGEIVIATFGPTTAKAAKEAGLRIDIEAPTEKYPSMTGAILHYLNEKQG